MARCCIVHPIARRNLGYIKLFPYPQNLNQTDKGSLVSSVRQGADLV